MCAVTRSLRESSRAFIASSRSSMRPKPTSTRDVSASIRPSSLAPSGSILEPRWKSVPSDVAASDPIAVQIAASIIASAESAYSM
jgi:hypothetical protein